MIRHAQPSDFESIGDIRGGLRLDVSRLSEPSYRVQIQSEGFLFPYYPTSDDFEADLPNYYVAEEHEQAVGFFRMREDQDIPDDTSVAWLRPELEDVYWSSPHAGLDGIGVLKGEHSRGIGSKMLQSAEQITRTRDVNWLFSFVVLTPVTNFASMMFHEKNGFDRVAVLGPSQYANKNGFKLDVFQSFLYGKQL
jgi:GNAT superfamily N-acetyltransferase